MFNFLFGSSSSQDSMKSQALDMVRTNIMAADKELNITYLNPALMEMLKEAEKEIQQDLPNFNADNLVGQNIDIFHKNPAHQRKILGDLKEPFETTLLVGGLIFKLIISPLSTPKGGNDGFVVEWQIADEKAKVESLEKSQAVIEFQPDGTIIKANDNFLNTMGYELKEIKGQHHALFIDDDYANSAHYKEFWNRLRQGEAFADDFLRFKKNGEFIWLNASYNPIFDNHNNVIRVVKYATDVTESKLVAMEATRQKLALDTCTANMMVADADFNIIYLNESLKEFLREAENDIQQELPNFDVDKLLGQNIDIFHKNPAHQRNMLDRLSEEYKTSIIVGGQSFNLVANPIFDENGERLGTSVEWQDGTAIGIANAIDRSQAVIHFQPDGTIIEANGNFLDVMGYELHEVRGKHHSIFIGKDYAKSSEYKQFWESLNKGEAQTAEFRRFTKDGDDIWIQASYNPIIDLKGNVVRIVKYASDITEQVRDRQQAAILSLVADNTDNSVIITDAEERIEYVNPGFERMTGYKLDEIRGKKPGELLQGKLTQPETKSAIREKLDKKEPFYDEILNYNKVGEPYWISLSINPIFDDNGKLERFISIQAEITETKERSIRFENCINAIDRAQAFIEFDMNGIIQTANENFLSATGYTLDEIKGKHHRIFCDTEYAQSSEYQQFWDVLKRGEFHNGEFQRFRKNGTELWIQGSYSPIFDAFGNPTNIVKYATDITEQIISKRENENGMNECEKVLQAVTSGHLTQKMEGEYVGPFKDIKSALNNTIDKLISIVQQVKHSAQSVNSAASEISSGSVDLSSRTEHQASSLEETAASMEELTGTVRQNSDNAKKASSLANDARGVAENGGRVVNETVEAMNNIEKSSQKISDIIGVIDEIAFQTNLLALNAAVEAARAGEAGKGFAVVASEVRSLAGRSASASKEIKALIEESGQEVRNGAELANNAGTTLNEIVDAVHSVTSLVSDIATASGQQSDGIGEVSSAISQMDETTQQNAALVEENTAAAQSLLDQARELEKLMAFFQLDEAGVSDPVAQITQHSVPAIRQKTAANGKANGITPQVIAKKNGSTSSNYDSNWEEF